MFNCQSPRNRGSTHRSSNIMIGETFVVVTKPPPFLISEHFFRHMSGNKDEVQDFLAAIEQLSGNGDNVPDNLTQKAMKYLEDAILNRAHQALRACLLILDTLEDESKATLCSLLMKRALFRMWINMDDGER